MKTDNFSKHIFWSYKPGVSLPPSLVIKQVIAYGGISDLVLLSKQLPAETIHNVIGKWKEKTQFKKRINFMEKIILNK